MSYLKPTVRYENRKHPVTYTATRARVQRSTDGGLTWEDVRSENLPLGTQAPLPIPDAPGKYSVYRVGLALTNGVDVGTEVFSNVVEEA